MEPGDSVARGAVLQPLTRMGLHLGQREFSVGTGYPLGTPSESLAGTR